MVDYAKNITIEIQLILNRFRQISMLQDALIVVFSKFGITQYRIYRVYRVGLFMDRLGYPF